MKILRSSILLLLAAPCLATAIQLDIQKFGAKGDGKTLDTQFIQHAIDACSRQGGGTIRFAAGQYVSGTILLKDNVTLQLDEQATLLGSLDIADYSAPATAPTWDFVSLARWVRRI